MKKIIFIIILFFPLATIAQSQKIDSNLLIESLLTVNNYTEVANKYGAQNLKNNTSYNELTGLTEYSTTIHPLSKNAIKLFWKKKLQGGGGRSKIFGT